MRSMFAVVMAVMAALAFSTQARADGESIAPLQVVLLAPVRGEVDIDAAGKVVQARVTTPVADELRTQLEDAMRAWTFVPAAGHPAATTARVRLTVGAPAQSAVTRVWIDDAAFADGAAQNVQVTPTQQVQPPYPSGAASAGVPGYVLVAVRVGLDGKVVDAVAVQGGLLEVTARKRVLEQALAHFEAAALRAARDLRFTVAVREGATPTAADLTLTVPIRFAPGPAPTLRDGQFRMFVRSPQRAVPWLDAATASRPFGGAAIVARLAATGEGGGP